MPTTTTTTTTSDASGAVTTVTTTMAVPDAAPAGGAGGASAPVPMHNGHIASIQHYTFPTEAAKAEFASKTAPIWTQQNATGNSSFGYCLDTSAKVTTYICIWESPAAFLECEGLFGELDHVAGSIGSMEAQAYLVGNITPEVQAKISAWDSAPGFTCKGDYQTDALVISQAMTPMDAKSVLLCGKIEFNSVAELDEYTLYANTLMPIVMNRVSTMAHTRINETTMEMLWIFKSYDDIHGYVSPSRDQALPALKPFYEWLPRFKSFGGMYAGNTEDAALKELFAPWDTWKPVPFLSGSLGGKLHIMLQKAMYSTTAARDTALKAQADGTYPECTGMYASFPVGANGTYSVHFATDTAANRAIQGAYAGNEPLMATLADMEMNISYFGGNKQVDWTTDFAGWQVNLPQMVLPDYVQVNYHEAIPEITKDAVIMVQEIECNDAASYDVFAAISNAKGPRNDPSAYGGAQWKVSPTKVVGVLVWANGAEWVKSSAVFAEHAEKMMTSIKSMTAYVGGNITPDAQKDIDMWSQAPWCTINKVEFSGKFAY